MAKLAPGIVIASVIGLALAGNARPIDAPTDSIALERASPPVGTTLVAGQDVEIALTVKYELRGADSGTVALVIEDDKFRPILPKGRDQQSADVKRGSGEVTLTDKVPVQPRFRSLEVYVPLVRDGSKGTKTFVHVSYPVRRP